MRYRKELGKPKKRILDAGCWILDKDSGETKHWAPPIGFVGVTSAP